MRSDVLTAGGDDARLDALRRLGLMDTAAEERFDRLAELASVVCGAPIALVTLVDRDRQWFKARVGLDVAETPREVAFCDHAIRESGPGPFVVEDAGQDVRFASNPLVTGAPGIRFYAGQVIRDKAGFKMGTLCVIDRRPRSLDATQRRMLAHLAGLVEAELHRRHELDLLVELEGLVRTKAAIVNSLSEGLVVQDASGAIVDWNPAAEHLLGLTGDELAGRTSADPRWQAMHDDGSVWPGEAHPSMVALGTGEPVTGAVMGVHRPDGTRVWLRVNARPVHGDDGAVIGALSTFADITVEHHQRVLLNVTWETAPIGLVVLDARRRIVRCNATYAAQAGRPARELIGIDAADTLHPDDRAIAIARRRPIDARSENDPPMDARVLRPDGTEITVAISTAHLTEPEPMVIAATVDTTEQHRLTGALVRFRYLFENANDVIAVLDRERVVRYASPSLTRILDVASDRSDLTDVLREITHPDDRRVISSGLGKAFTETGTGEPFTARLRDRHGTWRHFELVAVNLLHEPAVNGIVVTAHDVTEREQFARELEHRVTHDHLTGLAVRVLFEDEVTRALARAVRDRHGIAVCYLDLDGFKAVNDAHGHAAGDTLLIDIGARLRASVRAGDLAARIGGDEFAVLLDPVRNADDAYAIVTRIREAVLTVGPAVGASIGIALNEPGDTTESILRRADAAQYRSKAEHNSTITIAG